MNQLIKISSSILILCTSIISCVNNDLVVESDDEFIDIACNAIQNNNATEIKLNKITNFDWERVCIFSPYTPVTEINTSLGFDWKQADKINLQDDEVNCLIVFINNKKVVKYILFPRNKGDFSNLYQQCYANERAIFKIQKRDNGRNTWYLLKEL